MAQRAPKRQRGTIRKRGGSFQVVVYAGQDPVTGKRLYLTDSASTEREAERIRRKFVAQVDEQRNARTRATFGAALTSWMRTHDVEESTLEGYHGYIRRTIEPALGDVPIAKISALVLEEFYADLRRCRARCRNGEPAVDHRTGMPHECRTVRHKGRPGRPTGANTKPHVCDELGCVVVECPPHACNPMSASTIRQIHFIISAAFAAAVRWGWLPSNPAEVAKKPRQRPPQPRPPSPADAARIIDAAWAQDDDWGTLVWLVMVTGMRRAELLALRWVDIDLSTGTLTIRRNYVRAGRKKFEKDTKTNQMRRISLDASTVEVLTEHWQRYEAKATELGETPSDTAFLFSYKPLHDVPADPNGVSHRYARLCEDLSIDSHIHALRHYSATELLTAGVDLRTVAGRLGHGGGGATTLRVYAAWVGEADRKAAELLGGRMQRSRRRSE